MYLDETTGLDRAITELPAKIFQRGNHYGRPSRLAVIDKMALLKRFLGPHLISGTHPAVTNGGRLYSPRLHIAFPSPFRAYTEPRCRAVCDQTAWTRCDAGMLRTESNGSLSPHAYLAHPCLDALGLSRQRETDASPKRICNAKRERATTGSAY